MNDTSPFNPLLDFAMWTYQEAYLPPAFHTAMGIQKVLNCVCTPGFQWLSLLAKGGNTNWEPMHTDTDKTPINQSAQCA